jgi:hypothetical protein
MRDACGVQQLEYVQASAQMQAALRQHGSMQSVLERARADMAQLAQRKAQNAMDELAGQAWQRQARQQDRRKPLALSIRERIQGEHSGNLRSGYNRQGFAESYVRPPDAGGYQHQEDAEQNHGADIAAIGAVGLLHGAQHAVRQGQRDRSDGGGVAQRRSGDGVSAAAPAITPLA